MFIDFFYSLKNADIPVTPTSFLVLHRALDQGLIDSLEAFYTGSRAILVKSERHFDAFDQIFAHHFEGADLPDFTEIEFAEMARALLDEWLRDPQTLADTLGMDADELGRRSKEELLEYFLARLKDQEKRHAGGSRWIGTGGTSPVGHSGHHPGGLRVGGYSRHRSALSIAMERRYRDYSTRGPLTQDRVGEAMKRLRNMLPAGPKDQLNLAETLYQTVKNGGEIDLVFGRRLKDRLKVVLAIDNGGWSMEPHVPVVQTLFDYARAQFRELKTFFFHNTVYDTLWADPQRRRMPQRVEDFAAWDPHTRLILVGDASMAPFELLAAEGSIYTAERNGRPSIECLKFLAQTFPHCVWLNPVPADMWGFTRTIANIRAIFPMFELTLDGLEGAVQELMAPKV